MCWDKYWNSLRSETSSLLDAIMQFVLYFFYFAINYHLDYILYLLYFIFSPFLNNLYLFLLFFLLIMQLFIQMAGYQLKNLFILTTDLASIILDMWIYIFHVIIYLMGVYLAQPQTSKKINQGNRDNVRFVSGEMQGWRKNMEDAAIHELDIGDGNSLFAVFDGHGGPQVSYFVSEIFVKMLKQTPEYGKKDYVRALDKTFMKIDELIDSTDGAKKLLEIRRKVFNVSEGMNQNSIGNGTGCTANVVLVTPQKYVIANAGDSRSALCRDGRFQLFSQDHKPQSPEEQQRITRAGGSVVMGRVNGGLNLTRSFGDFDYKRNKSLSYTQQMITCKPDIRQVKRDPKDQFMILGCDGIWQKYVDCSQGLIDLLKSYLRNTKDLKSVIENLLDSLLAKDTMEGIGCDNMTAILVTLK